MSNIMWFVITVCLAVIGGTVFNKLKMPAGALVGALLAVGFANIATDSMYMYPIIKDLIKIVAGLFIGMTITAETVKQLTKLVKPVIVLAALIIMLCAAMGYVLYRTTPLDIATSLFCVAPGGVNDMSILSMDMGADAAIVAVLQVMRLLSVYLVSMPLTKIVAEKIDNKTKSTTSEKKVSKKMDKKEETDKIVFTIIVTAIAGVLGIIVGRLADFSVLIMVVSMVVTGAVNVKTEKIYMPKNIKTITQMMSGAFIGMNFTMDSLMKLKTILLPALLVCVGFIVINVIIAYIFHKVLGFDFTTSMLSTSAGGATESALVAADFGADPATVSVLQVSRMVCVITFYPIIIRFLIG